MLDVDAYARAQFAFGPAAGVWRVAPRRCVIGCWVPLGKLSESGLILRTERQGFLVLGEGATWAAAFRAAERTTTNAARATTNGASMLEVTT